MIGISELARAVAEGLAVAAAEPDVVEAEVFASTSRMLLARLSYTSHIPCNGVEEPKSSESYGLGVRLVLAGEPVRRVGFGSEASDLGPGGVRRAMARARASAVPDPDFHSLPRPGAGCRTLWEYHDAELMALSDEQLVEAGWRAVDAGLRTYLASSRLAARASDTGLRRLGLILGGDVTIRQQQMAIASTHMPNPQTDRSTVITSAMTGMVEAAGAKGTGWFAGTRLADFDGQSAVEAARGAIDGMGGERVRSGAYAIVFGPQPVADLLSNLVIPACRADRFQASSTPFLGQLGRPVSVPGLSLYDHGALPGLAASRGITCEGLPTGRTDLIRDGLLVGCLASWYDAQRLLHDPALAVKLGATAAVAAPALIARHGFRVGATGAGRAFDAAPTTAPSNVMLEAAGAVDRDELLRAVGQGLYVGRIWYTYPVNGLRSGDFTCTAVGDSFIIRDGRLAAPVKANAIRINDNIGRLLGQVVGVTRDLRGTPVWGADEVIHAPEIAVTGVPVEAIGQFMEDEA